MKDTIKSIVKEIGKGTFFDSHYIIETLIKEYSDDYFDFIRKTPGTTECVHGKIAQLILDCGLVERISDDENKSISYTIHSTPSKCALWKRK